MARGSLAIAHRDNKDNPTWETLAQESMSYGALDQKARFKHKLKNLAHSGLLICGMIGLLFGISWLLLGLELALWAMMGWAIALFSVPRISPRLVMRMYRARALTPAEFSAGYDLLERLVSRANLPRPPRLYYIPSSTLNAFSLGSKSDAAISLTDGHCQTKNLAIFQSPSGCWKSQVFWAVHRKPGITNSTRLALL